MSVRPWASLALALALASCAADRGAPEPAPRSTPDVAAAVRAFGPALGPAAATGFAYDERRALTPRFADGERRRRDVDVTLPARADGEVTLRSRTRVDGADGVAIRLSLAGARAVHAEVHEGYALYRGALGAADVVHRPTTDGDEDYVRFASRPAEARVAFTLRLGARAAGLRLVANVLEVLDAGGRPRLRALSPWIEGADGRRSDARLSVAGCAHDTSPIDPVGRPVTAPTVDGCTVTVAWDDAHVVYPAVLDPSWKSTADMVVARSQHSMTRVGADKILIVGGKASQNKVEIYTPPAPADWGALGTFAVTSDLPFSAPPTEHVAAALPGDRALIAEGAWDDAGSTALTAQAAIYDLAQGTWQAAPAMAQHRYRAASVTLPDGRVLVTGGRTIAGFNTKSIATCEVFTPAAQGGAWQTVASLAQARAAHSASVLPDGGVMVAGGEAGNELASTEWLPASLAAWQPGPSMTASRRRQTATTLADGRVLLVGGNGDTDIVTTVELYTPQAGQPGTLATLSPLFTYRTTHTATRLDDGRVMIAGGEGILSDLPNFEIYGVVGDKGSSSIALTEPFPGRRLHAAISLGGQRVLVTGGAVQFSDVNSAILYDKYPLGIACTDGGDCASGLCADGVCCDKACAGACEGCSKKKRKTQLADGTCGPIADEAPAQPNGSCTDDTQTNPCGDTGTCDGKGACRKRALGTTCGASVCKPGALAISACDGKGACVTMPDCGLYTKCASETACASSCIAQDDCVATAFCDAGACKAKGALGDPCVEKKGGVDCASGHCADGVCCNDACKGACRSCRGEDQGKTQKDDGTCGLVAAGKDPRDDCPTDPPSSCQRTGSCDGKGACSKYDGTTACGPGSTCELDPLSAVSAIYQYRCTAGACLPEAAATCGGYRCEGTGAACGTTCGNDAGCAAGYHCDASKKCVKKGADGSSCAAPGDCASNVCEGGVCCNTTCGGQCESCALPGSLGTCIAVTGAAPPGRPACGGGSSSNPCSARTCDGVDRTTCAAHVGGEVTCGQPGCLGDAAIGKATCGGNGACREAPVVDCAPYTCANAACVATCAKDGDCASDARCEAGKCIPSATCADGTTLRAVDGSTKSCAPFRCDEIARTCIATCTSSAACAAGNVCHGDGRCAPPLTDESEFASGCAAAGPRGPRGASGFGALLLGATAIAIARWRRRALAATSTLATVATFAGCGDEHRRAPTSRSDGHAPAPAIARALGPATMPVHADVTLPDVADAPFTIRDRASGVAARVTMLGAAASRRVDHDGVATFAGALAPGVTALLRTTAHGVEDYVHFPTGAPRAISYDVSLSPAVAGLRLVDDVLELLDEAGAPRLRVERPWATDGAGVRHRGTLGVAGCAVDRSPRSPYRRAVTDPGERRCTVTVELPPMPAPVLVDPGWAATKGKLVVKRAGHTANRLPDGTILLAGGADSVDSTANLEGTSEIYDPQTDTFAITGALIYPRGQHSGFSLPSGRVVIGGGLSDSSSHARKTDRYDPQTGLWSPCGTLLEQRYSHAAAQLADGTPMILGGYHPQPDVWFADTNLFDDATCTWSQSGQLGQRRRFHVAALLPDGKVMAAAGAVIPAGVTNEIPATSTEIYDPVAKSWSAGPVAKTTRTFPFLAPMPEGLLIGGGFSGALPVATVEFFRFSTNAWEPVPSMVAPRLGAGAVYVPIAERALVATGYGFAGPTQTSEGWSSVTKKWTPAGTSVAARAFATASLLDDGSVLLAGGGIVISGTLQTILDTAERFGAALPGAACTAPGQCASGFCADGVCCDEACKGTCRACSAAKKGSGADGVCEAAVAGQDPHSDCVAEAPSTCGTTGSCNGKGACALFGAGTACAQSCVAGQLSTGTCDGSGACNVKQTSCGLYACGPSGCATTCTTPAECATTATCTNGACVPNVAVGQPCTPGAGGCASGFCVDGVCCAEACDGPCVACKADLQQPASSPGGNKDGLCLPSKAGAKDPHDVCKDSGPACKESGICDGAGTCKAYQAGDTCFPPVCTGSASVGFGVTTYACAASGCVPSKSATSCGPNKCAAGVCQTTCAKDGDCTDAAYCDAATSKCVAKATPGGACTKDAQCLSGFCTDGFCCNARCDGQCASCGEKGQEGHCVPASGAPRGQRPPCGVQSATDVCGARRCDGVDATSCKGLAGAETVCRAASCSLGHEQYEARCDGKGACGDKVTRLCEPYACGPVTCLASCKTDAECVLGNRCVSGTCAPLPRCDDDGVLRAKDGSVVKACGLYRCIEDEGTCRTTCTTSADCVASAVCGSDGACTAAKTPTESEEPGCACSVPGSSSPGALPVALAALATLASRRRRRVRATSSRKPPAACGERGRSS